MQDILVVRVYKCLRDLGQYGQRGALLKLLPAVALDVYLGEQGPKWGEKVHLGGFPMFTEKNECA